MGPVFAKFPSQLLREGVGMVDWKKKIEKSVGGDLQADEQLEAGLFVQPAGAIGRSLGVQLGGIGGLVAVTRSQEKKRDAMDIVTDSGIGVATR